MKQITPVQIWKNGQLQQADNLNMYIVHDNLLSSATFYYQLIDSSPSGSGSFPLSDGNLTINGQDYIDWGEEEDINDAAYVWAAGELNLTLV
jgi:hypothetical protein